MGNPTSNEIFKRIHLVLGNLVNTYNIKYTYVDKYEPWMGIFEAELCVVNSAAKFLKFYTIRESIIGCDMIILVKYNVDWELTHQKNQAQINK